MKTRFVWLALLFTLASVAPLAAEERPNILFAIADDWGWPHAGAYGDAVVKTPTFDRLAKEGVMFRHAFISSPSCTPSRAAILTGQWHWRLEESANLHSTLQTQFPVYPDLLETAGYHVGHWRKAWGPGEIKVGGRTRNPAGPTYKDFDAFLAARKDDQPFCFWLGSSDPHRGYDLHSGEKSGIDLDKIELPACFPDSREVRGDVADYYVEVQRFDSDVGKALARLEELGELDNTIVVMTGDHGMPFPRCKSNLYDTGARVCLAVRWPKHVNNPGRTVEDFVSLTDLAPTFLEASGVAPPAEMTGRSLMNVLASHGLQKAPLIENERDHVLYGMERHVPGQEAPDMGGYPMRAIRTAKYLYIRNFTPERWPAGTPYPDKAVEPGRWLADCDNGPTKFYMVKNRNLDATHQLLYNRAFGKRPAEELYDLSTDPDQLDNVAALADFAEVKTKLAEQLTAALKASNDPRVLGEGARLEGYPYYGGGPKLPGWKAK